MHSQFKMSSVMTRIRSVCYSPADRKKIHISTQSGIYTRMRHKLLIFSSNWPWKFLKQVWANNGSISRSNYHHSHHHHYFPVFSVWKNYFSFSLKQPNRLSRPTSAVHSSEIRGLRSTKCSSVSLQNLLYFMYKKTHVVLFVFHFVQLYIFTLWMPWSMST